MVGMVSPFISELDSMRKKVMEVESAPCCAMCPLEDVIPLYHVSAGVCTVSCGMGSWHVPKCITMAGDEHFSYAVFLTWAQLEESLAFLRYSYWWQICC